MGEIADSILEGAVCQCCGVYMEDPPGYPQTCFACEMDTKEVFDDEYR